MLKQPEELGVSPAVTTPVITRPHGSLLLVLNGGWTGNSATPVDSYANTWAQVGHTTLYRGYQDRFAVSAYLARDAIGGPGHTVSIVKQASATGEMSVPFVEIRDARVLQDFSQSYPAAAFTVTSGEVTTTGPATLVAVWWGDGPVKRMMAIPHDGFSTIDRFVMLPDTSGVQCAVAVRQVHAAGTYDVSWTAYPVQGAILWLFAFQP
jgi:hypothetical protein